MQIAPICLALVLGLTPCLSAASAAENGARHAAEQLFRGGKFGAAAKRYAEVVAAHPDDAEAVRRLGEIALLANRLDEAGRWLDKALALKPDESDVKVLRAEVFYRRDQFGRAAAALDGVDTARNALVINQFPTLNVAKLNSFEGQTPYLVDGAGSSNRLELLRTDPLPLVSVRVNGGAPVTFFIDTGGSEVALDTDFANELGVPRFGAVQGTFSGGQHAEVEHGRIESLALGSWTVENLPAVTLPLRQLSEGLGVKRIDGILGTTLFYHFLTTLDLPRGALEFRRKTAEEASRFAAEARGSVAVPFWIAGDHFMVGWGRVDTLPPSLLFVDTGLAGAGVKLAQSAIGQAGIKLQEDKATSGAGAGGTLKTVPYVVGRLSFGKLTQRNVPGLFDGPFPWENLYGFYLAGMVGHDFFKPYAMTFDFDGMRIFLK